MLGSTAFPWFVNGPVSLRTEDCLLYLFSVTGIVLSLVAYDYQVWTLNHLHFSSLFTWSLAFQFAILCAGDWSSSGTILFISCLHWPYFTFTCQIENFVISLSPPPSLSLSPLFHLSSMGGTVDISLANCFKQVCAEWVAGRNDQLVSSSCKFSTCVFLNAGMCLSNSINL